MRHRAYAQDLTIETLDGAEIEVTVEFDWKPAGGHQGYFFGPVEDYDPPWGAEVTITKAMHNGMPFNLPNEKYWEEWLAENFNGEDAP